MGVVPTDTEASVKIQEMGILPLLSTLLNPQSSCTPKVANIIAEVAKNGGGTSPYKKTYGVSHFVLKQPFYCYFGPHIACHSV